MSIAYRCLLLAAGSTAILATATAARAGTPDPVSGIEARIHALEAQLASLQKGVARHRHDIDAANQDAAEARAEAREADRRANAAADAAFAGRQSFSGAGAGGLGGFRGGAASSVPAPINGLGRHGVETAGAQKASALGEYGRFQLGGVSVQLGGFIDATTLVRSRNIVGDVATNWNSIPYAVSPLYHEPEFRGSARNSRLALLIEGKPSSVTKVAGYFEADFKTAGVSSNSNESNSYALALRNAYATFDRSDWGFHVLAGQSWSFLTLNRIGMTPRQEQIPLVIDSAFVPGFNWTRNMQIRFDKDFLNRRVWAGISFESPEATYSVNNANATGVIGGTPNYVNAGGSLLNSTANYSDDIAPDVIAKLAFDPNFGHYEVYGLARFLHDRVTSTVANTSGRNNTSLAGGVGGGLIFPLIGPKLTFQASGLVGQGIGRYGEAQLPDATLNQNGTPIPLPAAQVLLGVVYHPTKAWDLYSYVGSEQVGRRSFNEQNGRTLSSFGYGNGYYADGGCATERSTLGCVANTRGITQGTLGAWWRFLHGDYGTMQVGTQWSYTRRDAFDGTGVKAGSVVSPKTDENVVMFSFRYLPFL